MSARECVWLDSCVFIKFGLIFQDVIAVSELWRFIAFCPALDGIIMKTAVNYKVEIIGKQEERSWEDEGLRARNVTRHWIFGSELALFSPLAIKHDLDQITFFTWGSRYANESETEWNHVLHIMRFLSYAMNHANDNRLSLLNILFRSVNEP